MSEISLCVRARVADDGFGSCKSRRLLHDAPVLRRGPWLTGNKDWCQSSNMIG